VGTQQPGVPLRLAVQSSRRLLCDALIAYFSTLPDLVVVGHVAGPAGVAALCRLRRPDVLLVDAEVDSAEAFCTLSVLHRRFPQVRAVLVYERMTARELGEARRAGATVLVPSRRGLAALLAQVRRPVPAAVGAGEGRPALTDRELEIIMLIGCGHSVPEIAVVLGIAADTVENHKRRIFAKLQARSSVDMVARAAALGMPTGRALSEPAPVELTARESDILVSISLGHTVRQTAHALGIAPKTVENTQSRLFGKLGVRNRARALAAGYALGLIQPATPDPAPAPTPPTRRPKSASIGAVRPAGLRPCNGTCR
jgi:DNA-binding NarL/FixJ family response regulator